MARGKLFMGRGRQVVLLPHGILLEGAEVRIRKIGVRVVLEPITERRRKLVLAAIRKRRGREPS